MDKNVMIFIVIASVVLFLVNYFVFKRLILIASLPSSITTTLSVLIWTIYILELVYFASFKSDLLGDFYIFFAALLGISFMLFVVAAIYNVFYIGLDRIDFNPTRREALFKILNISTMIGLVLYLFRGFWGGFKEPIVNEVHVKIKNLQSSLNIVQITDVHIGKFLKKDFMQLIVDKINKLDADVVVVTGDLVDLKANEIGDGLDPLKEVKSKYGVYFVPGNHEYYHGVDAILEFLEGLHVKVLGNTSSKVGQINLAGVYDIAAPRLNHPLVPNLDEALQNVDRSLPTVLLSHQPKFIEDVRDEHGVDLMLSGHTHGGQIFPFGLLVRLVQPYLYGLYEHTKQTQIYVSSGVGFWGPPIRFLAPSEIVLLKLTPKG